MTALLSKFALPIILVFAGFASGMITFKQLEKPVIYKCPDCKCECPKPDPAIDLEKVKGRNAKIEVHQHYETKINGDSLVVQKVRQALHDELEDFKVRKCK